VLYHRLQVVTARLSSSILLWFMVRTLCMYVSSAAGFGAFFLATPRYNPAFALCFLVSGSSTIFRIQQLIDFDRISTAITRTLVGIRLSCTSNKDLSDLANELVEAADAWPLTADPFGIPFTSRVITAMITAFATAVFAVIQVWLLSNN
jgi:hypothetical protein